MRKIFRGLRGYIELLLIPAIAVLLPWWLSVRFYRLLAYVPFLYCDVSLQCLTGAKQLNLLNTDEATWLRACKVGQMIDLADTFLVLFRGKRFIKCYFNENITTQLRQQQVIFVPHFGAGMFIYKMLADKGVKVTLIGNDFPRNCSAQGLISRLRLFALTKLGTTTIWNDNMMGIRGVLREQQTLLVLPDVPRSYGWRAYSVTTDIGEMNIAARYFELAEKRHIPVMTAILDIDVISGHRIFDAKMHNEGQAAEMYAQQFAQQAAAAIEESAYLWRMLLVGEEILRPMAKK